jgi:hypothetical protein
LGGRRNIISRDLIETALAHVIGDKAERAYRRSDVLEKRRNLMESMGSVLRAAIAREHHSTCGATELVANVVSGADWATARTW